MYLKDLESLKTSFHLVHWCRRNTLLYKTEQVSLVFTILTVTTAFITFKFRIVNQKVFVDSRNLWNHTSWPWVLKHSGVKIQSNFELVYTNNILQYYVKQRNFYLILWFCLFLFVCLFVNIMVIYQPHSQIKSACGLPMPPLNIIAHSHGFTTKITVKRVPK